LLLVAAALLLAGCGRDMKDLEDYALEVKSRKTKNIEPIPQPKPYEPFEYVAVLKDPKSGEELPRRDPFLATLQAREAAALAAAGGGGPGGIKPDPSRPKEPLEEFSLDSLRMVGTITRMIGTITKQKTMFALIKAPDTVVHMVQVGDHLGQNFGKVTVVSETEVVLMEIIPDGLGGWTQRQATVAVTQ
jgi:type IV pilus assembly protein PilP